MSVAYNEYLVQHRGNVYRAFEWLQDNLADKDYITERQILMDHDASKDDSQEYYAYDDYFYGNNRSYAVVEAFNRAWLHHIHHNPHHWQHWVLLEDDPKTGEPYICIEMPVNVVFEMIADWWSFSWNKGNLYEIFDWYEDHKNTIKLHKNTRKLVERILSDIKEILDKEGSK